MVCFFFFNYNGYNFHLITIQLKKLSLGHPATSLIEDKTFTNMEIEHIDAKNETLSADKITDVERLEKDGHLSKDSDVYRNNLDDEQCDPRRENSDLDLSNCRRHTPSYCFLPNNV